MNVTQGITQGKSLAPWEQPGLQSFFESDAILQVLLKLDQKALVIKTLFYLSVVVVV